MKKNNKKVILTLCIILSIGITLSLNAFAALWDTWGPQYYTPYDGAARTSSTTWRGDNLKWSSSGLSQINSDSFTYWELEARNSNPNNVWGSIVGSVSNLPGFYVDAPDTDDRAFGTHSNFNNIVADTAYYGQINFNQVSTYTGNYLTTESEVGFWLLIDGIPARYEQHPTQMFTVAGGTTSIFW